MDGVLPSGIPGRRILEFDECNMYYSVVKNNANKTTTVVFISCWVLRKCGYKYDHKTWFKAQEAIIRERPFPYDELNFEATLMSSGCKIC